MFRNLLALLVACVLSTPSLAADLPARPRLTSPVVDVGWSGMYAGINGGWNLGSFSPFCRTCGPTGTTVNLDDNNPFVGGHIGYLYQGVASNFVLGPEIGIQAWTFKSQAELIPATVLTPAVLLQQRIDWLAYANVRAGFTITPNVLVYLTGGAAWAHVKGEAINLAALDTTNEQSLFGVNIGGGVEFKLTEYLVFGGEYRHYDFGKVSAANPALNLMGIGNSDRLTTDQAMGRLTYRLVP